VRRLAAGLLACFGLAAAGCGGGNGGRGNLPAGASVAPRSAIAFISVDTDFSSDQWQKVASLASHFPGTPQLIAALRKQANGLDFNRDVKPALGNEVDVVWLDTADNGNDVVALTKPSTKGKLELLLQRARQKGQSKAVTAQVGDWVVVADSQAKIDKFKHASSGDKLAGDKDFKDAYGKLDPKAAVRAWISGDFVQTELDRGLESSGAAPRLTHGVGELHAISGDVKAEDNGATLELDGVISPTPDPATFSPSLQNDVPGGALLYVATTHLDAPLQTILRLVGESKPSFTAQLNQVESVLGISLENDVYPLLKGEAALAVYPGGRIPPILFVQKVSDEAKADSLLRRFGAIAQLGGGVKVESVQLAGKTVQKLTFTSSGVSVYDGVAAGKLFVTNASSLAEETISGPGHSLADDQLFQSARDAANVPGKVAAFAYGDMKNGLPYLLRLSQQTGSNVPPQAFANVKPLQGAVLYLVKDGDALRLSGFQTIK
jgi:hypothetical protein